jgi:hypothetical protein
MSLSDHVDGRFRDIEPLRRYTRGACHFPDSPDLSLSEFRHSMIRPEVRDTFAAPFGYHIRLIVFLSSQEQVVWT